MDSQRAIVGCDDTRALIFDMPSGRLIRSLPPNPGPVTALYVSKMDDFLITAGQSCIELYVLYIIYIACQAERSWQNDFVILNIHILNFLCCCCCFFLCCCVVLRSVAFWANTGGNKITFYSFRNEEPRPYPRRNPKGKPLRQLLSSQRALINASQPAFCFDISRDSQLAAIASGRSIQIWQINVPQLTQTFEEHTGAVTCISFSPNCEFFASGAEDKTVIVWNLVFSLVVTTFKVKIKSTILYCQDPTVRLAFCMHLVW